MGTEKQEGSKDGNSLGVKELKSSSKKTVTGIFSFLLVIGIVAGCTKTDEKTDSVQKKPSASSNSETAIKESENQDFPTWGYDLQETRHVPFKEITKDNVSNLGVAWEVDLKKLDSKIPGNNENFPIVVNGVAYISTSQNYVFAFDAATGSKLWEWAPDQEIIDHTTATAGMTMSRGVAVANGTVYNLLNDDRLVSIDAKTGKTIKMINLWDTMPDVTAENGYFETTAPIVYKGNVYIGMSGGDNAARGFVMAFKADDLSPAWDQPFWTVPPKGQDWLKDKYQGGGAVWCPVTIDPETDIMYFSVGNPAPDFYGEDRPGANPYTDSVVAVNSQDGKLVWAQQEISHDLWDYDAAASPMLLNATVGGKQQKVVVEGGKSGQWWAWDAATGKVIYDGVAFTKIDHPNPTPEGVLVFPGTLGGENYAPETYDPDSNYVLIPSIESPYVLKSAKDDSEIKDRYIGDQKDPKWGTVGDMGTTFAPPEKGFDEYGNITAIDMNTGKVVYQVKTDDPMRGGFTSTDSGLAFYGELNGKVDALDIKAGKVVWTFQTDSESVQSAPAIYERDGKEYVIYATSGNSPKVIAFKLDGDSTQSKSSGTGETASAHSDSDSDSTSSSANIDAEKIFGQSCAACHGNTLEGGAGPALAHIGNSMTEDQIYNQIINGGGRMPGGIIKGDEAKAVAAWLAKKK